MKGKPPYFSTDFAKLDATPGVPDEKSPELTQEDMDRAVLYHGDKVIRGPKRPGRPKGSSKAIISVRVDQDVLAYYKSTGRGWQTRLNAALRASMPKRAASHKVAAGGKR